MLCEACLEFAEEEFGREQAEEILLLLDMVPDHSCDRIDTEDEIPCACPHHRP